MLTVNNLKKIYPKSDRVAVDDITFELRPGAVSYTHLTLPTIA